MYTMGNAIQNVQSFHCTYDTVTYIHGAIPLVFLSPCWSPFCSPFVSPSTYLAPSSCDRNRPPRSQVACKLTPFAPPFTQLSHPFQPQLSSAKQRRPREYSGSCYPEHSPLEVGSEAAGWFLPSC
jgi:hypothetical protein